MQDAHLPKQRKVVRSTDGENGFSMEVGPFVSYANRNGVSAVFSGEVSSWPGVDMVQVTHDGAPRALCIKDFMQLRSGPFACIFLLHGMPCPWHEPWCQDCMAPQAPETM